MSGECKSSNDTSGDQAAPNPPVQAHALVLEQPPGDLAQQPMPTRATRKPELKRRRWCDQPAVHGLKAPLPAKRHETKPRAQAPFGAQPERSSTNADANLQRAEQARHSAFGGDCRPSGVGEHRSAATCCLTFELRGGRRDGAWPARRMMAPAGARAKRLAGGRPLQRRVRRHRLQRRAAFPTNQSA